MSGRLTIRRQTTAVALAAALLGGCAPAPGGAGEADTGAARRSWGIAAAGEVDTDPGDAGDIDPGDAGDTGPAGGEPVQEVDVIFSPQPLSESHNARVAQLIAGARRSIDVAMYSFSDAAILDALGQAADRGVRVRFLLDTAAEDARKEGAALLASTSGQLERRGINVRYVNKVLHHKLMIVDGPRDDLAAADTAILATGSANWSNAAATRYDENTLFLRGNPELLLRFQAEMNLLWEHSRDVVVDPSLPYELSTAEIDEAAIPDDPGSAALFTSDNFTVSGDTFTGTGTAVVGDALVEAIRGAERSIDIASGHLRSRPIAEALMEKKAADPSVRIRVYLDQQEYVSQSRNAAQERALGACLEAAGADERAASACRDRGFLFGYAVGRSGVGVRYKLYAYRWNIAYAKQMHDKYLIIDGDTLYTGTYNLSDNAEHDTFENVLLFEGPEYEPLIARFRENFEAIWETGRPEGRPEALALAAREAPSIPLVFDPMALSWDEVTAMKALLRESCPAVNSREYRRNPVAHPTCPRP